MFSNRLNYKIINLTALFFLLYLLVSNVELWIGIGSNIFSVCSPFIIAFVFAYAFTPIVNFLIKKKIKRTFAVTIVVVGLLLIVTGILAVTLPMLYEQIGLLIKMLLEAFNTVITKYDINLLGYETEIKNFLSSIATDVGNMASTTTTGIVVGSIDFLGKLIIGFVAFVYFLADMNKIRAFFRNYFKNSYERFYKYLKILDKEVTNYIGGMGLFMVIQCIEYCLIFLLIGHPNWFILGVLAGVTNLVPYFGGIFTNIVAIVTASVVSTPLLISTIVVFVVFSQIDCYLISPKVYGKTNGVSPLITIMVVSIGGSLLGILGIIVALPIFLLLRETYRFYRNDLKTSMDTIKETIKE